jgi:hypothetical protein
MSVENNEIIDAISINKENIVVLTISDHLDWGVENHLELLESKLNSYIEVLESQEIYNIYPDSTGKEFAVQIAFKHKPSKKGKMFLNSVSEIFENLPYYFSYYELE